MPKILFSAHRQAVGFNKRQAIVMRPMRYSTLDDSEVIKMAADDSGITESQIEQCLTALENQVEQLVCNGHSIDLGPLGTIRFGIRCKSVGDAEDVSTDLIYRRRLLLKPSKALQEAIKKVNIEIVPDDTVFPDEP